MKFLLIDTKLWLNHVGLLNGKPAPQELYVTLFDEKVLLSDSENHNIINKYKVEISKKISSINYFLLLSN